MGLPPSWDGAQGQTHKLSPVRRAVWGMCGAGTQSSVEVPVVENPVRQLEAHNAMARDQAGSAMDVKTTRPLAEGGREHGWPLPDGCSALESCRAV